MMTSNGIHRESAQERRWNMYMGLVVAAVGFLVTMYGLAIMAGLFAEWFTRPY